jgi:hypothetical protein
MTRKHDKMLMANRYNMKCFFARVFKWKQLEQNSYIYDFDMYLMNIRRKNIVVMAKDIQFVTLFLSPAFIKMIVDVINWRKLVNVV